MKTAAERIKHIREQLQLSQEAFGQQIGVSKGAVSQWEGGDIKNLRPPNLFAIQRISGFSAEWVATGAGPKLLKKSSDTPPLPAGAPAAYLPLVSWVQAGQWKEVVDNYRPGEGEKFVLTTRKVSPRAYALRVVGDSMENPNGRPTYPQGSIIIVDPERAAVHGSPVIVRLEDSKEATFKQLVIEGDVRYLKPLNPRYPIIRIEGQATLCGVVVQTVIDED
ncbi:MAG TPA: XRE family transcriptional regulator [Gammaproteobacteria bacterium]|nr:XRE family transcriptional regulator [Gammaproteobacteria bacterium]